MNSFVHAIKAELLKGRRTFLRYSPIVVPFATVLILLPVGLQDISHNTSNSAVGIGVFNFYFLVWLFFMMPMYSLLVAILNYSSEHVQGLWKHINTQPVSGTMQVLAKHFYAWCYLIAATTALSVMLLIVLLIAKLFFGVTIGLADVDFWRIIALFNIFSIVGGIAIITLLCVLTCRVASFTLPAMVGFFGVLLPIFASADSKGAPFIPWTLGKVLLDPVFKETMLGAGVSPVQYWWVIVPAVQVVLLLCAHSYIQKKKPQY
ncbi:MAG: ABC transporter permease [Holophagaceae bacterium]|nr:ABC transporter permease [Holophagaceae bacterium]